MTDDPTVAALLDERGRAHTDEHRAAIDHELAERGYGVKTEPADEPEPDKPAAKRSEATGGDKTAAPQGRTATPRTKATG